MATTEEILNQLLSLPLATRARVAQRLLESLESADDTNRRLWDAEIESRLDAYERGELQAVPGDEVLARLREQFPRKNLDTGTLLPQN